MRKAGDAGAGEDATAEDHPVRGSPRQAEVDAIQPVVREAFPREEEVHEPACACLNCGGALRRLGEDVTEVLCYVPAPFKAIGHVRTELSCRVCGTSV